MKTILTNLFRDSLFRNSFYSILATAVMAGLGFFFWLFSAHLFITEEVGLAAALISVMNMVGVLALIGFDTATIRFLSRESRKNESINTGIIVIGLAALVLSSLFVLFVGFISPQLAFIQAQPLMWLSFIIFTAASALNLFTDAIFIAYRQTKYTFIINGIFSVLKVALPFAFLAWGAFGIFAAAAVAQTVGFILSIVVLMRTFEYRPQFIVDFAIIKRVWKYSAGNYAADTFNFLPLTLLPIIITNHLGAEQSAYYYIVMMIVSLLYVIPISTMRSLFAEGSHDESTIPASVRNSLKTTSFLLLPAMLVLFVGGGLILMLFGTDYSDSGLVFLRIMTITGVAVTSFTLYGTLFRLTHNIPALIFRNFAYAASTIALVYLLLPYGLVGIGLAYMVGNIIGTVVSHILFRRHVRQNPNTYNEGVASRLTVKHVTHTALCILNEYVVWPLKTMIGFKYAYLCKRRATPHVQKTILCYPDKPRTYHVMYKMLHLLGWKITNNPKESIDAAIHFEDITLRKKQDILTALQKTIPVLNTKCLDISKKKVDEVFKEVFGYEMTLNPRTYHGECVRKSDINAVHDGTVVTCPTEPEDGYVYQKFVNTKCGDDRVMDLRLSVFGGTIDYALKRYKTTSDMFDLTIDAECVEATDIISTDEYAKVITFCKKIGLDLGEIDALRSCDDGRLYIIDVNNTPAGPIGPLYRNKVELERWYTALCKATERVFTR